MNYNADTSDKRFVSVLVDVVVENYKKHGIEPDKANWLIIFGLWETVYLAYGSEYV